jgi:hypothetical protein
MNRAPRAPLAARGQGRDARFARAAAAHHIQRGNTPQTELLRNAHLVRLIVPGAGPNLAGCWHGGSARLRVL